MTREPLCDLIKRLRLEQTIKPLTKKERQASIERERANNVRTDVDK